MGSGERANSVHYHQQVWMKVKYKIKEKTAKNSLGEQTYLQQLRSMSDWVNVVSSMPNCAH